MIIHCRLIDLFKNYLKTVIVGFGQADVLGFTVLLYTVRYILHTAAAWCMCFFSKNLYELKKNCSEDFIVQLFSFLVKTSFAGRL